MYAENHKVDRKGNNVMWNQLANLVFKLTNNEYHIQLTIWMKAHNDLKLIEQSEDHICLRKPKSHISTGFRHNI